MPCASQVSVLNLSLCALVSFSWLSLVCLMFTGRQFGPGREGGVEYMVHNDNARCNNYNDNHTGSFSDNDNQQNYS